MASANPRIKASPYLLLVLTALFWSGNWVVARALLSGDVTPFTMVFWRWAIALAIILPFAYPHLCKQWGVIRSSWKILVLLGTLGTFFNTVFAYIGLQYTTATNGAMLNSSIPILIILISWVFLGTRFSAAQWLGVFISLTGVLSIICRGDIHVFLNLTLNIGDIWVLISMVAWATYTVCLKWRPELHPYAFIAALMAVGVIAVTPLYLHELWMNHGAMPTHLGSWIGLLYVGIFPAVIAYMFWNQAVEQVGPSRAGLFVHLMPVFGSILAIFFLGEALHSYHFYGIALILIGIYLTNKQGAFVK